MASPWSAPLEDPAVFRWFLSIFGGLGIVVGLLGMDDSTALAASRPLWMRRVFRISFFLAGMVSFAVGLWLFFGRSEQDYAIARIRYLKGTVNTAHDEAGNDVLSVDLDSFDLDNRMLERMAPHLQSMPGLRHLRIGSKTKINADAVKQMETLTQLETLDVNGSWVSKALLENLRQQLPQTKVSGSKQQKPIE